MKEPDWPRCRERELWMYVGSHLAKKGFSTVLVGGAVVSVYTEGAYRSGDLDLVVENFLREKLPSAMEEIGFRREGGRHYIHPQCSHLFIEFLSPPTAIGDDTRIRPRRIKNQIKILSPTDCIRDRLASFIHFQARECLDQAVLVALRQPFSLPKVRQWCEAEGTGAVYAEFIALMKSRRD